MPALTWICGSARSFSTALHAPVIVAGAGPTGLVLGLHLARYGIKSVIVERSSQPTTHPQAHFINNRTMEIFRHMDGLAAEVDALSPPLEEWRRFIYCRSLSGELLGQVDHFEGQAGPCNAAVSPEPLAHLPQNRLLPMLIRRAQEQQHLIKLMMGCSVVGFTQSSEGVQVQVRDHQEQQVQVQGSFLAAADGAHSGIRQSLGIQMDGDPCIQHLINIHFRSRRLGLLAAARPGMLYFVFNAQLVAVLVAHNIQEGEFVAQVPYFPPLQSVGDFSQETCMGLIRASAGLPDTGLEGLDIDIKQIKPWTMSAEVARRFSEGRVFLLGDAAHRFPPAGGFGMNTGVQDAHNLGWKLAAVMQGWAGQQLLGSYEMERKPVAESNTALSVSNWREAIRLPQALGLDPGAANLVSRLVASAPLPQLLGKQLLEGALNMGRALAAAPLGPLEPWRKGRLTQILSSGQSLRLQFPQEDLGFRYHRGALLPELKGLDSPGQDKSPEPRPQRGAAYVPSAAPGCRLPHRWLLLDDESPSLPGLEQRPSSCTSTSTSSSRSSSSPAPTMPPTPLDAAASWDVRLNSTLKVGEAGQQVSTLDLVAAAAPGLLLLVDCAAGGSLPSAASGPDEPRSGRQQDGGGGSVALDRREAREACGLEWVQAALSVAAGLEPAVSVVAILSSGGGGACDTLAGLPAPSGQPAAAGQPGVLDPAPRSWSARSAVQQILPPARVVYAAGAGGGAGSNPEVLLVRPDGHVAWRWRPTAAAALVPGQGSAQDRQVRQAGFEQQLLAAVNFVLHRP